MSLAVMLKTCYYYSDKKDKQTILTSELTFWGLFDAKKWRVCTWHQIQDEPMAPEGMRLGVGCWQHRTTVLYVASQ